MKIVSFSPESGKQVVSYGSMHLTITHLARLRGDGSTVVMHLNPGGKVGGHPANTHQLFMVVAGSGQVSGGDKSSQQIQAGQAALWEPDEWHETTTETGLTAVVIEFDEVQIQVL